MGEEWTCRVCAYAHECMWYVCVCGCMCVCVYVYICMSVYNTSAGCKVAKINYIMHVCVSANTSASACTRACLHVPACVCIHQCLYNTSAGCRVAKIDFVIPRGSEYGGLADG